MEEDHLSPPTSNYSQDLLMGSVNLKSCGSSIDPEFCDSPIDRPPSSAFTSETGSVWTSESELPHLPPVKATKQSGLFDFFPKIPSEELHTKWRKRKRENQERDQEEYAERKKRDEAEKLHKQARRREQNRVSQNRRRERIRKEKDKAKWQDSSVSLLCYIL